MKKALRILRPLYWWRLCNGFVVACVITMARWDCLSRTSLPPLALVDARVVVRYMSFITKARKKRSGSDITGFFSLKVWLFLSSRFSNNSYLVLIRSGIRCTCLSSFSLYLFLFLLSYRIHSNCIENTCACGSETGMWWDTRGALSLNVLEAARVPTHSLLQLVIRRRYCARKVRNT